MHAIVQHDEDDRLAMSIGGGNYGFFASYMIQPLVDLYKGCKVVLKDSYGFFASLRPASTTVTGLQ